MPTKKSQRDDRPKRESKEKAARREKAQTGELPRQPESRFEMPDEGQLEPDRDRS